MRRVRSFAASLSAVVLLGVPADVFAATVCESSLPFNVNAGTLEPIAIALLQQSQTFRQQCQRIAATFVLRIQVFIVPAIQGGAMAETTIRRFDTGALRAEVLVEFGTDYVELLAHEFEHVLEQVERVSLLEQVSSRQAWFTDTGAFETQRARDAGARARQECDQSAAEALEANRRPSPRLRHEVQ